MKTELKTAEQHYKEAIGETRFNLEGSVTKTQIIYAIESARNEPLDHLRQQLEVEDDASLSESYEYGRGIRKAISLIDQLKAEKK